MYKTLPVLITTFMMISCNSSDINTSPESAMMANVNTETSFASLHHNEPSLPAEIHRSAIHSQWNDMNELNGIWTKLEKDQKGYLVYNPLNGGTPRLVVKEDEITIYWWLDGPSKFKIQKSSISDDKKILTFEGLMIDGPTASFTCDLRDAANHKLIWDFTIYRSMSQGGTTHYTWATTRKEMENLFRSIDQKRTASGGKERTFLTSPFE